MSEEFQNFVSNVYKLPLARRPIEAPQKLVTLESLWLTELCANPAEEVKEIYSKCKAFLESYIKNARTETPEKMSKPDSKMEFDHKTANAVIPEFSGDSSKLLDFIDCVTYYSETLNQTHTASLLSFINKVKLRGKAKLAVSGQNDSLTNLLSALKSRYQPRVTVASTQAKLTSLKQRNRTVTEFVNEIDSLVAKLSELQVEECGESSRTVITAINDTAALNALKMGSDDNIKRVLLSSTAKSFSAAVSVALDAEASFQVFNEPTQAQVNFIHKKGNGRGKWNSRGKWGNRGNGSRGNYSNREGGNNHGTSKGASHEDQDDSRNNASKKWRGRGRGRGQTKNVSFLQQSSQPKADSKNEPALRE